MFVWNKWNIISTKDKFKYSNFKMFPYFYLLITIS